MILKFAASCAIVLTSARPFPATQKAASSSNPWITCWMLFSFASHSSASLMPVSAFPIAFTMPLSLSSSCARSRERLRERTMKNQASSSKASDRTASRMEETADIFRCCSCRVV